MPYQSRQINHQLMESTNTAIKSRGGAFDNIMERSKSSRPKGIRNMFESQITVLS